MKKTRISPPFPNPRGEAKFCNSTQKLKSQKEMKTMKTELKTETMTLKNANENKNSKEKREKREEAREIKREENSSLSHARACVREEAASDPSGLGSATSRAAATSDSAAIRTFTRTRSRKRALRRNMP